MELRENAQLQAAAPVTADVASAVLLWLRICFPLKFSDRLEGSMLVCRLQRRYVLTLQTQRCFG